MTRAQTYHAIADAIGCDPELVAAVAVELKLTKRADVEAAVRERLSGQRATAGVDDAAQRTEGSDEPEAKPVKKAAKPGLTLSQRRALLRLLDGGDDGCQPATPFKALPYEYTVEVGYADRVVLDENGDDVTNDAGVGVYTLTDAGRARAETINPSYRDWSAGETVVNDESRPTAGTHRAKRAAERAADEVAAAVKVEDTPTAEVEVAVAA
jgi:hypothetical protein